MMRKFSSTHNKLRIAIVSVLLLGALVFTLETAQSASAATLVMRPPIIVMPPTYRFPDIPASRLNSNDYNGGYKDGKDAGYKAGHENSCLSGRDRLNYTWRLPEVSLYAQGYNDGYSKGFFMATEEQCPPNGPKLGPLVR